MQAIRFRAMRSSRFLQGSPLDEEIKGKLADKIGSWIIDHDREKRLSFSLAYPFVRRPLAQDAIQLTAAQNAGIGVLVFVPGADLPVMTLNQIKMVLQIAAAYGEPLDKDRIKEIIPTIAGALVCRGIARKVAGFVPALGWLVKGGMGYLGTLAIGEAALTYFEQGGSIAGVAGMLSQAGNAASDAAMKIRNQRAYQVVSDAGGSGRTQSRIEGGRRCGRCRAKCAQGRDGLSQAQSRCEELTRSVEASSYSP